MANKKKGNTKLIDLSKKERKERKKAIKIIVTLVVLITAAILIFSFSSIAFSSQDISYKINRYGLPSLFMISMMLELVPQLISPVVTLSLAIIAGINVYLAIPIAILGSIIGSVISYSIGKKYMFLAVNILAKKESVEKLTTLMNNHGKIIVPIAALSPLPYLSVVIGAMNFSRKNFIIYGLIPRALSFLIYGILTYVLQTL